MSFDPHSDEAHRFADAVERAAADYDELVGTAMILEPPTDVEAWFAQKRVIAESAARLAIAFADMARIAIGEDTFTGKAKQNAEAVLRAARNGDQA